MRDNDFPIKHKTLKSFDGTKIAYQVMGRGQKTIMLCNGLGGSFLAWKPLVDHFGKRYRLIAWDYRGLMRSGRPQDEKRLTVTDHAKDLDAICKKEKVKRPIIGGWSMGVQVLLEYYRQHPNSCRGMLITNGTFGNPFDTALNNRFSKYVMPPLNQVCQHLFPIIQPCVAPIGCRVLDSDPFIFLVKVMGLVSPTIDVNIIRKVAKELISTDLYMYHGIMHHLGQHDAFDMLANIGIPVLIIAGAEDMITPIKVSSQMAQTIPKAEYFVVPRGTHYSLLEFPEMINLRVEKFLSKCFRRRL
jgi:pimeloyl-ACP methyl ester carboxylesterase